MKLSTIFSIIGIIFLSPFLLALVAILIYILSFQYIDLLDSFIFDIIQFNSIFIGLCLWGIILLIISFSMEDVA